MSERLAQTGRFCALWGAAVTVPLYLELHSHPQVLVNRGFSGTGLIVFSLALSWLPVLSGLLPEKPRPVLEAGVAAGLTSLLALGAFRPLAASSLLLYGLLVVLASAAATAAFLKNQAVRSSLPLIGILSLLAPFLFLASPVVSKQWRTQSIDYPEPWSDTQTPVVVVIFDEFPLELLLTGEQNIATAQFPTFARLAREAHWFRQVTTVADFTELAVPALLTGRYPRARVASSATAYPRSLFTYLPHRPIKTLGPVSRLCPDRLLKREPRPVPGLAQDALLLYLHRTVPESWGLSLPSRDALVMRDGFDPVWREGRRVERYRDFISSLGEAPNELVVMHLALPHSPMEYYPDGTRYNLEKILHPFFRSQDEWSARLDQQRHILQTQLADRLLGELITKLEAKGLYDKALLVVMADHGTAFVPGQPRRHLTPQNYPSILRVPLFVKPPGNQSGQVDDRPVETVDVLPTMASLLGGSPDPDWDGKDLLEPEWPGRPTKKVTVTRPDLFLKPRAKPWGLHSKLPLLSGGEATMEKGVLTLAHSEVLLTSAVTAMAERFGDPILPYRAGPFPELLGKSAEQYEVRETKTKVGFQHNPGLSNIDPSSRLLPGLLVARFESSEPARAFAVELNGKLCATGWSTPQGQSHKLRILLPPESFQAGENPVTIHLIEKTGEGKILLHKLSDQALGRLEAERIVTPSKALPIAEGNCGRWHHWRDSDGDWRLDGWAFDFEANSAPEFVSVFEGSQMIARVQVDIEEFYLLHPGHRAEVSARLKPSTLCGFALELNPQLSSEPALEKLRLFAHFPDRAVELNAP